MFVINCRKDLQSDRYFDPNGKVMLADHSNEIMPATSIYDTDRFLNEISGSRVLLLIHGFNNRLQDALMNYWQTARQVNNHLRDQYDYIIGFTWPAGANRLDYFHARKNASAAGKHLRMWVELIQSRDCTIDGMGHSMAARVGVNALRIPLEKPIRNIISFAPAISRKIIHETETFKSLLGNCSSYYLFHSIHDHALKYGFRLVEWQNAVGYSGPDDRERIINEIKRIKVIDCQDVIHDHNDYAGSDEIFQFLSTAFGTPSRQKFYRVSPDRHRHKVSARQNREKKSPEAVMT
ncbi:MAG: alpha/beta hydrolase [Candidatus Marinimicrobia bacterium]|nr:alpha/beta hydrolase [Candidatus Neomarinimicrobiota bacterium]